MPANKSAATNPNIDASTGRYLLSSTSLLFDPLGTVDAFLEKRAKRNSSYSSGTHHGLRSGPLPTYAQYAREQKPFSSLLYLNLIEQESPESLGFSTDEAEKKPFHLADIVGHHGPILTVEPADGITSDKGRSNKDWHEYLDRGCQLAAKWSVPAFAKRGPKLARFLKIQDAGYRSYEVWRNRQLARTQRLLKPLIPHAIKAMAIRRHLEDLCLNEAQLTEPQEVEIERRRAYFEAAARQVEAERKQMQRYSWSGSGLLAQFTTGTHDRTGLYEAARTSEIPNDQSPSIAACLTAWNSLPDHIVHKEVAAKLCSVFAKRLPGRHLSPELDDILVSHANQVAITEAASKLTLETTSYLNPPSPLPDAPPLPADALAVGALSASPAPVPPAERLRDRIETLGARHRALLTRINHKLPDVPRSQTAYSTARGCFIRQAGAHLEFGNAVIKLWFCDRAPQKSGDTARPAPATTPRARLPYLPAEPLVQALTNVGALDLVHQEPSLAAIFTACAAGASDWGRMVSSVPKMSYWDVPNLLHLTRRSMHQLGAPTIEIGSKIIPSFSGGAEAFLLFDGMQQLYNPALAKKTGFRRALLERPTIIAQGTDVLSERLTQFGYRLKAPVPVINQIAKLKARSDRNQLPLRPILPQETPGYIAFGPAVAAATVLYPDGTPIWIAGKAYVITPGWERRQIRINAEDLIVEARAEPGQTQNPNATTTAFEVTTIELGISHWDVTCEGERTLRITEDGTCEERELTFSARAHPDIVEALIQAGQRARPTPEPSTRRQNRQASVDVDPSVLQALNAEEGATLVALAHNAIVQTQTASQQSPTSPQPKPEWPKWAPSLDDFVEAFPPKVPLSVPQTHKDELAASMKRILNRFGPRYTVSTASGVTPMPPSPDVEQRAFALFCAERARAIA